ncbi:hypothetical protein QQX98_006391 [Neonectria punicea]|uniref:Uncharacterized protein n=1 Tax=Neonectria punicea TaxID=979145 RepID=A0ABR1H109_9HYPO
MEEFDRDIQPEIETIMRNVDLQHTEIYIRVYMIGKNEDACRPTIMVCCVDASVRREAKASLRNSLILKSNPSFALGSNDYPLEQSVPNRKLASKASEMEADSTPEPPLEVWATTKLAEIGRLLFIAHPHAPEGYGYSTGGVVVSVGRQFYQLTVGHVSDIKTYSQDNPLNMDPDACSIDGDSESESDDDDVSAFEKNMRRASMSFHDLSDLDWFETETEISVSNIHYEGIMSPATAETVVSQPWLASDPAPESPPQTKVGTIALHSRDGSRPNLDYALVSVEQPSISSPPNEIHVVLGNSSTKLSVRQVAAIEHDER